MQLTDIATRFKLISSFASLSDRTVKPKRPSNIYCGRRAAPLTYGSGLNGGRLVAGPPHTQLKPNDFVFHDKIRLRKQGNARAPRATRTSATLLRESPFIWIGEQLDISAESEFDYNSVSAVKQRTNIHTRKPLIYGDNLDKLRVLAVCWTYFSFFFLLSMVCYAQTSVLYASYSGASLICVEDREKRR